MPIHRAKPVEELYRECRGYDLVLVLDPLASALNRRLEHAHFGPFAITPRRLAAGRREVAEDRIAFLKVVDEILSRFDPIVGHQLIFPDSRI